MADVKELTNQEVADLEDIGILKDYLKRKDRYLDPAIDVARGYVAGAGNLDDIECADAIGEAYADRLWFRNLVKNADKWAKPEDKIKRAAHLMGRYIAYNEKYCGRLP